jgi:hypothetical protein
MGELSSGLPVLLQTRMLFSEQCLRFRLEQRAAGDGLD